MTTIHAYRSVPERDMSFGVVPTMTFDNQNTPQSCKIRLFGRRRDRLVRRPKLVFEETHHFVDMEHIPLSRDGAAHRFAGDERDLDSGLVQYVTHSNWAGVLKNLAVGILFDLSAYDRAHVLYRHVDFGERAPSCCETGAGRSGGNCSPPSWGWGCGEDVLDGGEGVEAVSGCGCDGGSDAGVEVGRPARAEAAGDFAIGRGGAQGSLG